MLRLKRPADKGSESAAAILLIADALQMLDPVFNRLDMTEHHRRARSQPELVRDSHHFQPLIAVNFQRRNLLAHAINQNFAAAARNRAQPRISKFGITSRRGIRKVSAKCWNSGGLNPWIL